MLSLGLEPKSLLRPPDGCSDLHPVHRRAPAVRRAWEVSYVMLGYVMLCYVMLCYVLFSCYYVVVLLLSLSPIRTKQLHTLRVRSDA